MILIIAGTHVRPPLPPEPPACAPLGTSTSVRRILMLLLLTAFLWALPGNALAHDSISLRPIVRVTDPLNLTIGDVAEVSGPSAHALRLVPLTRHQFGDSVTPDHLRVALEKVGGLNLGRIRLSGNMCELKVAVTDSSSPPPPSSQLSESGGSVRALITPRLAEFLGVPERDLRVTFEAADAALLDTPIVGRTISIHPSGQGDRIPVSVRIYDGDRVLTSGSIRVSVLVRRSVLIAVESFAKGSTVTPEGFRREDRWLLPSARPAGIDALGRVARRRVPAGDILQGEDAELPVIIKRGDSVSVECISGGFVVRTNAHAAQSGREGDLIDLQSPNTKVTFRARVSGPGQAVMVIGPGETR